MNLYRIKLFYFVRIIRNSTVAHSDDIQEQELWNQATIIFLWTMSQWLHSVFNEAEATWLIKIDYYGSPHMLRL